MNEKTQRMEDARWLRNLAWAIENDLGTDGLADVGTLQAIADRLAGQPLNDDGSSTFPDTWFDSGTFDTSEEAWVAVKHCFTPRTRRKLNDAPNLQNDALLEKLWEELGSVPCGEDECIEIDFLHFLAGTHREVIWDWFDDLHSKGVYCLMFPGETPSESQSQ